MTAARCSGKVRTASITAHHPSPSASGGLRLCKASEGDLRRRSVARSSSWSVGGLEQHMYYVRRSLIIRLISRLHRRHCRERQYYRRPPAQLTLDLDAAIMQLHQLLGKWQP